MKKQEKIAKVMGEFKRGKLTTHGKPVKNRKQAVAIAMSESSKMKKGGKVKAASVAL